ncbi:hypothetical protein [Nannocystis punicea]|uniref:Uncharacterized protein n=1 Tax=Nannocystis punicea TaxID=2995304 RepID=A0ABY7H2X8_9BACT|nr:hypothetical protein [Nannocystis poenicansa]WAS93611.1 hypothetical protein O0S08_46360 [Nannocystis poenicansa]
MSLVLLAVMIVYGAVRSAFWARGQWRFHRMRGDLPRVGARREAPAHLGGALEQLLGRSHSGRVRLVASARQVAMVLIIDPDVAFGCVRDFRFRLALADAWSAANAWLRAYDDLPEHEQRRLEAYGYTAQQFGERRAVLGGAVRRCVRAPALEPFPVADVVAVQRLLLALIDDLEGCERALLASAPEHPYRAVG